MFEGERLGELVSSFESCQFWVAACERHQQQRATFKGSTVGINQIGGLSFASFRTKPLGDKRKHFFRRVGVICRGLVVAAEVMDLYKRPLQHLKISHRERRNSSPQWIVRAVCAHMLSSRYFLDERKATGLVNQQFRRFFTTLPCETYLQLHFRGRFSRFPTAHNIEQILAFGKIDRFGRYRIPGYVSRSAHGCEFRTNLIPVAAVSRC